MTRTQIAVVVAGLLLGAQAGIAALNENPEAVATESVEVSEVLEQVEAAQVASAAEPVAQQAASVAIEAPVAVDHVFPLSANEPNMLPALVAYLDQRAVPQGPILAATFPRSADDPAMLPALVAYFDARNAPSVAAAEAPLVTALAPRE